MDSCYVSKSLEPKNPSLSSGRLSLILLECRSGVEAKGSLSLSLLPTYELSHGHGQAEREQ